MRALAWDDKPEYLRLLALHLVTHKIHLEVETSADVFHQRLIKEEWDFIITDLYSPGDVDNEESPDTGLEIARRFGREYMTFMVTENYDTINPVARGIPATVSLKSKKQGATWMAFDMVQELRMRGFYVDDTKVFLIYGRDQGTPGLTRKIEHFLSSKQVQVVKISGQNLTSEILSGLLDKMNDCGAFIAVCTPDDAIKVDEARLAYHPRQNVLMEIGMALGLRQGLQRLTILQSWGPSATERAELPSDLGGVVTIRVEGQIEQYFEAIIQRLRANGIQIER